jgi:hypothetical protein
MDSMTVNVTVPISNPEALFILLFKTLTPYTLAGFDLTIHSSNLLGCRRRPKLQMYVSSCFITNEKRIS